MPKRFSMKVAGCGLRFRGRNRILKKRNPQPATFFDLP
jgi:hypothetical protein